MESEKSALAFLGKKPSLPQQRDPHDVVQEEYECIDFQKGEQENTTWITLADKTSQTLGFCDFPWKIKGKVTVSGGWVRENGKVFIKITAIHPVEPPKKAT